MDINISLFEGERLCLGPIDFDKDLEIMTRWTHDVEWMRLLSTKPARPLSTFQLKKKLEEIEKDSDEKRNQFFFTLRERAKAPAPSESGEQQAAESAPVDRLLGFTYLYWIEWNNGVGMINLGIGEPQERGKGYGKEALGLVLRYAFEELNLFRLTAMVPEYNTVAQRLLEKAGFQVEVRRREALHRDGKYWDLIQLGLLSSEWKPGWEK